MGKNLKTGQLQIRVSRVQKRTIQRHAGAAGKSMSDWVLSRVLPSTQMIFQDLLQELARSDTPGMVFAELLELLGPLGASEYARAVSQPPQVELDPYWKNYVAATVEHAAAKKKAPVPEWTKAVPPLEDPVFGSSLMSLRMHLLTNSPPAFCRRNIFIDATIGDRV